MAQELLAALEASGLGHAARSWVWLYPLANIAHVLGAALLVGSILVFDLLVLRRRHDDAAAAGSVAIPLAALGLAVQAPSGVVLLAAEASAIGANPAFLFKMAVLVLGLANVIAYYIVHALPGDGQRPAARGHAMLSLGVWITVLLAGRAIAYL